MNNQEKPELKEIQKQAFREALGEHRRKTRKQYIFTTKIAPILGFFLMVNLIFWFGVKIPMMLDKFQEKRQLEQFQYFQTK